MDSVPSGLGRSEKIRLKLRRISTFARRHKPTALAGLCGLATAAPTHLENGMTIQKRICLLGKRRILRAKGAIHR